MLMLVLLTDYVTALTLSRAPESQRASVNNTPVPSERKEADFMESVGLVKYSLFSLLFI
jgi:hypothetical protein